MSKKPTRSSSAAGLRHRAVARLREGRGDDPTRAVKPGVDADNLRLLQELQVHQIELEMQNAELQEARDRAETLLEKFTDLYDFAPVGYLRLDERGHILEVNLTGAGLLGMERSRLIDRRFALFVDAASRAGFSEFLQSIFSAPGKQVWEGSLLRGTAGSFCANLQGACTVSVGSPAKVCRMAVSDVTTLKRAEEAQQRVEALSAANRNLREEILRREAVEAALTLSQQQQARLLDHSRQMQEQLRHLSHRMLQAQEEERRRISRELHDDITQTLVGISVHLENLSHETTLSPRRFRQQIHKTQRLVEKSVEIVHQFARELRPSSLDDLGLSVSLRALLKDFAKRATGITVRLKIPAKVEELTGPQRTAVYRVTQAALTNVAQHAQATRVVVNLRERADVIHLEIADNGKSFDAKGALHPDQGEHLGLVGMRERVQMVGGRFEVESAPGRGTTIRAQIPLTNRSKSLDP